MRQFHLIQRFQELVGPQIPQAFRLVELSGRFGIENRRRGHTAIRRQFPRRTRDRLGFFKRQFVTQEPFRQQRPDTVDQLFQPTFPLHGQVDEVLLSANRRFPFRTTDSFFFQRRATSRHGITHPSQSRTQIRANRRIDIERRIDGAQHPLDFRQRRVRVFVHHIANRIEQRVHFPSEGFPSQRAEFPFTLEQITSRGRRRRRRIVRHGFHRSGHFFGRSFRRCLGGGGFGRCFRGRSFCCRLSRRGFRSFSSIGLSDHQRLVRHFGRRHTGCTGNRRFTHQSLGIAI